MKGVSVITLTLNEEANIGACLESVGWADERIVVDSGSTDRTAEIAGKNGARVLRVSWEGYGPTKNRALAEARYDWVLWLDADERVLPELASELQSIAEQHAPNASGYSVARRAYFLGRWIRHCGWYPSRVIRFFKREEGRFSENKVHEHVVLQGSTEPLNHDLIHLTDPTLSHYFQKFNRYTSLAAEEMFLAGRRSRLSDLVVRPFLTFARMFFLRRGFLDGTPGLILCMASSTYVFAKYAKLWELENKRIERN